MSAWLLIDLQSQLKHTLDQRLAASARMVASLVAQLPAEQFDGMDSQSLMNSPIELDGVACQVRRRDGDLLLQTSADLNPVFSSAEPGYSEAMVEGVRWRLFTYTQDDIVITTADRIAEREGLYRGVLTAVAGPVLLALLAMLYATWWGIRVGLKPLQRLREALSKRDANDLTPIQLPLPHELQPLLHSVNQLLQRVDDLVVREKRFTSDAAHELRTPLTAIKTNVQLAQRLSAEQGSAVLAEAEASIGRMQRITEQLMLLAQLDAEHSNSQLQSVSLMAVVSEALADVVAIERIEVEGDTQVSVLAQPSLLEMVIRNLVDNGLRYSDGDVHIRIAKHANTVTLQVRDFGPGLNDQQKVRAMERFWRAGQGDGSGLGLSIVRQACDHQAIEVELEDADPGLCVVLVMRQAT